jgi:hypothetical protein
VRVADERNSRGGMREGVMRRLEGREEKGAIVD